MHIADHFYFNDHSGQGFGIELKNTRFSTIFVSSTDTSSTLPPYFYLNIGTGTPTLALRQRLVFNFEQDFQLSDNQLLTFLRRVSTNGRYRFPRLNQLHTYNDTSNIILNYPSDYGYVLGLRLSSRHRTERFESVQ